MGHLKATLEIAALWVINLWAGVIKTMTLQNSVLWATLIYTVMKIIFEVHAWLKSQRQRRASDGS